jgi:hypothetical protein
MCKEYNGWTNWETWVTKLWLDNDEYTYSMVVKMVDDAKKDDGDGILPDDLEEFVWEVFDQHDVNKSGGLFADFINSSMRTVDWQAIADAYNQDGY